MRGDLQRAALQRLAKLSQNDDLPPDQKGTLRDRILAKCSDRKKLLNGVNGVTESNMSGRILSRREFNSLLALAEIQIDEASAQSLLKIVVENLANCCRLRFATACSITELEDPPSHQLSYSLTRTLFGTSSVLPDLREDAQKAFLKHIEQVCEALKDSIAQEDVKLLLSTLFCLTGSCDAAISNIKVASPEFIAHLLPAIRELTDDQLLTGIESLLSFLNKNDTLKSPSDGSLRIPDDNHLGFLLRIRKRHILKGEPPGAVTIQYYVLKLFEHLCYLSCRPNGVKSGLQLLKGFKTQFSVLGSSTLLAVSELAASRLESLDASGDLYIIKASPYQDLSFSLKATCIRLACLAFVAGNGDTTHLPSLLRNVLSDNTQMSHTDLGTATLDAIAAISMNCHEHTSNLNRALRTYIINANDSHADKTSPMVCVAAKRLAWCLGAISTDKVVSTLYSLVNILASTPAPNADRSVVSLRPRTALSPMILDQHAVASSISLSIKTDDQRQRIYSNVIDAIAEMVCELRDEKIAELMISLLGQKFGRVNEGVDKSLVWALAKISKIVKEKDFRRILKLQGRARIDPSTTSHSLITTIMDAHQYMAGRLNEVSPYREILLIEVLTALIEFWAYESESSPTPHPLLPKYFETLSAVLPKPRFEGLPIYTEETVVAFRNMWFACIIHGVHPSSRWVRIHAEVLRKVAANSPLLTLESATNDFDADLELNPVLNRINEAKHSTLRSLEDGLIKLLPSHHSEIKGFDLPKSAFVGAVALVETLRSESGRCSLVLDYFDDANLEKSNASGTLKTVVDQAMSTFLDVLRTNPFRSDKIAYGRRELRELLIRCCDPVPTVQALAQKCCDRLISAFPALLCCEATTYVLLELLTLLWEGCLSQETDLYYPKFEFRSALTGIGIELRDSSEERKRLLDSYNHNARKWLLIALQKSPDDTRMVLQSYLAEIDVSSEFSQNAPGRQLALEIGRSMPANDSRSVPLRNIGGLHVDLSSKFMADLAQRQRWRYARDIIEGTSTLANGVDRDGDSFTRSKAKKNLIDRLTDIEVRVQQDKKIPEKELHENFIWAGTHLYASHEDEFFLVRNGGIRCVNLGLDFQSTSFYPFQTFRGTCKELGMVPKAAERTVYPVNAFSKAMEYKPTDIQRRAKIERYVQETFAPHLLILRYIRQHLQPCGAVDTQTMLSIYRLVIASLAVSKETSVHPLAREGRLCLVLIGLQLVQEGLLPQRMQTALQIATYKFALAWYSHPPMVTFGNNKIQLSTDYNLLTLLLQSIGRDPTPSDDIRELRRLLVTLLKDEIFRVHTWLSPVTHDTSVNPVSLDDASWVLMARAAWNADPYLCVHLDERFVAPALSREIRRLIKLDPEDLVESPRAAEILLGDGLSSDLRSQLKYLLYWAPVVPPTAITYFLPAFGNNPLILQYAMRSLLSHSIQVTFFYVPQIVQALRYDNLGYVEQFIMEASLLSPLFAHQIIWNMNANAYKDEDSTIPDRIKPTLDRLTHRMIDALSGEDKDFYEREFAFFNEVTSISGKLKPYIKRSKAEKKAKIDEEMKKIKLDVGVYLPSNPDGEVIGIDRKSGRPLQSHAKAPFMATFKIRRVTQMSNGDETMVNGYGDESEGVTEVMQAAIFKVGDDCRQDVLALQLISAFRNIFNNVGLDLYLFPYRVTATAPWCGVIDVLPNSISRDMLGREHVNGLYEYFMREHDGPNSTKFQKARNNFITSMAAYSIVTYLLQFKDRHNGNIMIDSEGHILHIDFGFCFDIAPGGITFESAPFKLTHEMITVISGPDASRQSQYYHRFEELCVKGFLACRPYAEEIIRCVLVMLDSGLPCFKGMTTIKNLRDRFVLDKSEREASDYMLGLIRASHENMRTVLYDQFQYATGGIPY